MNKLSYASVLASLVVLSIGPHAGAAKHRSEPAGLTVEMLDTMTHFPGDLAVLPANTLPVSSARKLRIDLGRKLFFDTRLSIDHASSCATCHDPKKAFGDAQPLATGFQGLTLQRHTPTLLNVAGGQLQFWDGRAAGLEEQASMPIMASKEMNMGTELHVVRRLSDAPDYEPLFRQVYGSAPNLKLLGDAIAAFEETLMTPGSPFDRYLAGDKRALTQQQKRGLALLVGKAACVQCHSGANLSDGKFHNIGLPPVAAAAPDDGRFAVTGIEEDRGAFKTPTLRNVAITGPYMHDGSVATLEGVVDHYNKGGEEVAGKSDLVFELGLTKQEKKDLVAFLKSLTGTLPADGRP